MDMIFNQGDFFSYVFHDLIYEIENLNIRYSGKVDFMPTPHGDYYEYAKRKVISINGCETIDALEKKLNLHYSNSKLLLEITLSENPEFLSTEYLDLIIEKNMYYRNKLKLKKTKDDKQYDLYFPNANFELEGYKYGNEFNIDLSIDEESARDSFLRSLTLKNYANTFFAIFDKLLIDARYIFYKLEKRLKNIETSDILKVSEGVNKAISLKCKKLIKVAKIDDAIKVIEEYVEAKKLVHLSDDITLLRFRFEENNSRFQNGHIQNENHKVELNNITTKLLSLLDGKS